MMHSPHLRPLRRTFWTACLAGLLMGAASAQRAPVGGTLAGTTIENIAVIEYRDELTGAPVSLQRSQTIQVAAVRYPIVTPDGTSASPSSVTWAMPSSTQEFVWTLTNGGNAATTFYVRLQDESGNVLPQSQLTIDDGDLDFSNDTPTTDDDFILLSPGESRLIRGSFRMPASGTQRVNLVAEAMFPTLPSHTDSDNVAAFSAQTLREVSVTANSPASIRRGPHPGNSVLLTISNTGANTVDQITVTEVPGASQGVVSQERRYDGFATLQEAVDALLVTPLVPGEQRSVVIEVTGADSMAAYDHETVEYQLTPALDDSSYASGTQASTTIVYAAGIPNITFNKSGVSCPSSGPCSGLVTRPGDRINYEVQAMNNGSAPALGLKIFDFVPEKTRFVSVAATTDAPGQLLWSTDNGLSWSPTAPTSWPTATGQTPRFAVGYDGNLDGTVDSSDELPTGTRVTLFLSVDVEGSDPGSGVIIGPPSGPPPMFHRPASREALA